MYSTLMTYSHVITKLWLQGAKFLFCLKVLSCPPSFLFSYFVRDVILSLMVLFLQCFIECWATTPFITHSVMLLTFLVLSVYFNFLLSLWRIADIPDSLSCLLQATQSWSFSWWCTCKFSSSLGHVDYAQHVYCFLQ